MYKKSLLLCTLLLFTLASSACTKQANNNNSTSVAIEVTETTVLESINVEDTEPATEYVDVTSSIHEQQALISTGVLKEEPESSDNYGNKKAYFTGIDGTDFIAIINDMTELPSELIVGNTYDISHSSIELRSFPGQYPEVYKIMEHSK